MGNSGNSGRQKKQIRISNQIHSNTIQVKIVPNKQQHQPQYQSISCQTQNVNSHIFSQNQYNTILIPMQSPKTDSYSGSVRSLNSSNNISNKNVNGNKQKINESQHVDSQVYSNFISGIVPDPKKLHRITEYQSKESQQAQPISSVTN